MAASVANGMTIQGQPVPTAYYSEDKSPLLRQLVVPKIVVPFALVYFDVQISDLRQLNCIVMVTMIKLFSSPLSGDILNSNKHVVNVVVWLGLGNKTTEQRHDTIYISWKCTS